MNAPTSLGATREACPACGWIPQMHEGFLVAEGCRCTPAEILDADIKAGRFMAPDVPMTHAEAVADLTTRLRNAEALDRTFRRMGHPEATPGWVLIPVADFARLVAALEVPAL